MQVTGNTGQRTDMAGIIVAMNAEPNHLMRGADCDDSRLLRKLRRFMLAILIFAMTGTFFDLVMFRHYQDAWQLIPLSLLGLSAVTLAWHGFGGGAVSLRAFQILMALLVVGGIMGVILHWKTSAEFHAESGAAMSAWQMAWKVLHSKVPPTLAPAALVQMGLMGLAYSYRHPALSRREGQ